MRKSKGFGRKREMLTGEMAQTLSFPARAPWFARSSSDAREAAIIGGGIASALLSLALLRRGWQVTLTAPMRLQRRAPPAIARARCIRC